MTDTESNDYKASPIEPEYLPIKNPTDVPIGAAVTTTVAAFVSGCIFVGVYGILLKCNLASLNASGWFLLLTNLIPLTVFVAIFGMMFRTNAGLYVCVIFIFIRGALFLIGMANTSLLVVDETGNITNSSAWLASMLSVGPLEELCKATVYLGPLLIDRIRSGYSVIYYAAIAGLVFGVLENLDYSYEFLRSGLPSEVLLITATYRIYSTTVLHILLTVLGSLFLVFAMTGVWKNVPRGRFWLVAIAGWLAAAFLHGLYDAMLMAYHGNWKLVSDAIYLLLPFVVLLMFVPLRRLEIEQANQQVPATPVLVGP